IGAKMIVGEGLFGLAEPIHVPTPISLGIVAGLIGASIAVSLLMPQKADREEQLEHTEAASLIAEIDPHASITASVDGSMVGTAVVRKPADDSQLMPVVSPTPSPDKQGS